MLSLDQGGNMTRSVLRRIIRFVIVLVVVLMPQRGSSTWIGERNAPPLGPMPVHPGRLIVKYRPSVDACAHCLLSRGIPFASVTGRDSLDQLNRRLGVQAARPLFFEDHNSSGMRAAVYRDRLAAIQQRFPERARRMPAGASVPDLSNIFVLELPSSVDVRTAAALYAADPDVEYAEPDRQFHATFTPDDPFFSSHGSWGQSYDDLWGLKLTDAPTGWDTATGVGTVVAVIDTGVDWTHPDLAANVWTNLGEVPNNGVDDDGNGYIDDVRGWDFVDGNNSPGDGFGHGTHVAGTVAAVGNNGTGVIGMAWGAQVMNVRALDANGNGYDSDLARAITYAVNNGADVLNNSWGGFSFNLATGSSSAVRDAIQTAVSLGVVVIASAGNDGGSVAYVEPAGYPEAIAVGATDAFDQHAGFSNSGAALSVSAPGVGILSTRAAGSHPIDHYGDVVQSKYLELAGTSMAAPHVAGLSAMLLSLFPTLTPDEVRWHLELNADQVGYPGYEGQPWNPYIGWGRINAARVFDVPPVTTRLSGTVDLHTYAGQVMSDVAAADLKFTTRDPVAWTLNLPVWLSPASASGSGPGTLSFSADATSLGVGDYSGSVDLSAPAAVDGGATLPARLQTHRDERIGARISITDDHLDNIAPSPVQTVSDGAGTLLVWSPSKSHAAGELFAARIDGAGNVSGPFNVDPRRYKYQESVKVGFDGRNYLIAWAESETVYSYPRYLYRDSIKALRVSETGQALDDAPIVLMTHTTSRDFAPFFLIPLGVAFDGGDYSVFWRQAMRTSDRVYVRRVGTDGTLRGKQVKLFPKGRFRYPWFVTMTPYCLNGSCLLVWGNRTGATIPAGFYTDDVYAVRYQAGEILDASPLLLLSNINNGLGYPQLVTAGDHFTAFGGRVVCTDPADASTCTYVAAFAHLNAAGVPTDPDGLELSNQGFPMRSITFDGTNYLGIFVARGTLRGTQVFGTRFAPDGQVLDDEGLGLLLLPNSLGVVPVAFGTSMAPVINDAATSALLTWVDTVDYGATSTYSSPISAQRVLAHPPSAGLPERTIGSIGALSVAERSVLMFRLSAPALTGGAVTFSGSSLPAGAFVDPTGVLRWMPDSTQAGTYEAVHVEATDGSQTVGEDLTITVSEANLSLSGTMVRNDGGPVGNVALRLRGHDIDVRTLSTSATGRFRFDDLSPGRYRLRVTRPSSRDYASTPLTITMGTTDQTDLSFVVTPR
jgi:subtilisin family serine protease